MKDWFTDRTRSESRLNLRDKAYMQVMLPNKTVHATPDKSFGRQQKESMHL